MATTRHAVCPVCGSYECFQIFSTSSQYVANHLLNADNIGVIDLIKKGIEKIWGSTTAAYYHCSSCTFEFADPFIAANSDLYSLIYKSESNYPVEKWEYKISYESINNLLKTNFKNPRLLEIGAGNGSFLKTLTSALIPLDSIFAIEFSGSGANAIESFGIKCFDKDINLISEGDLLGKVNIVCMFQVLEHMGNINELFSNLRTLTILGSRIYISVPNNLHRSFFDKHGYYYDLPPIHLGRYNLISMIKLTEKHGWKIRKHAIQPTNYKERIFKFIFTQYEKGQHSFNTEKVKIKLLRLFLRYGLLTWIVLLNLKIVVGLRKTYLGASQWFELERIN